MSLPRKACQEESLEPGPQDLPPGSDTQVSRSGMIEDPASAQGIEASSDNKIPSTGEGEHHIERIHQVSHYNSYQNTTEVNLDAATLASPSGK